LRSPFEGWRQRSRGRALSFNPQACILGLLDDHLRGFGHVGQFLLGKIIAPSSNGIRYRVIP
jgi:hypothetical protein